MNEKECALQGTQNASAEKILAAATDLFACKNFSSVSIKQIAAASGVNSALISYYFGGKKNLYQEVLYKQAEKFLELQNQIRQSKETPLRKLLAYADSIAAMQTEHPYHLHLIFRELLSPQPTFENYVKNKLYRIHQFMAELVDEAIDVGEIKTHIKPTHVAFTLESTILLFFLMKKHVRELGQFAEDEEINYLRELLTSYIESLH